MAWVVKPDSSELWYFTTKFRLDGRAPPISSPALKAGVAQEVNLPSQYAKVPSSSATFPNTRKLRPRGSISPGPRYTQKRLLPGFGCRSAVWPVSLAAIALRRCYPNGHPFPYRRPLSTMRIQPRRGVAICRSMSSINIWQHTGSNPTTYREQFDKNIGNNAGGGGLGGENTLAWVPRAGDQRNTAPRRGVL